MNHVLIIATFQERNCSGNHLDTQKTNTFGTRLVTQRGLIDAAGSVPGRRPRVSVTMNLVSSPSLAGSGTRRDQEEEREISTGFPLTRTPCSCWGSTAALYIDARRCRSESLRSSLVGDKTNSASSNEGTHVTSTSIVFENLVALRRELGSALDRRLRTDFDLPLELFEAMTAILAGERNVASIARRTGTDEPETVVTLERLSSRGLCLLEARCDSIRVRGLTIAGGYLLKHASAAFEDQLNLTLGGAMSSDSETLLGKMLRLVLTVDARSPDQRQSLSTGSRFG
jgi:hypothetical protein